MKNNKQDTWIIGFILCLAVGLTMISFYIDTDIMWHFKTGEYIWQHKAIPKGDVFSWHKNLNWMCHEWLYDIFLYLIYNGLGLSGMKILLGIAFISAMGIAYWYNRNKIYYPILYILFTTYTMYVLFIRQSSDCARPSEFSILIFMVLAVIITEERKGMYWISGLLSVLYANIHGGSIMQIILLPALCIFADLISCFIKGNIEVKKIKCYLILMIIMFIASCINPYGITVYKYTTDNFLSAKYINSHIQEWSYTILTILKVIPCVGLCICIGASKKFKEVEQVTFRKTIIIAAFLCQGLTVRRMMFPATCILMMFGYEFLEEYMKIILEHWHEKFDLKSAFTESTKRFVNICGTIALLVCMGVGIIYFSNAGHYTSYKDAANEKYQDMVEGIQYMKDNNITGKIMNRYNYGGLFILNDMKTFVDPRCDPFMEAFSNVTVMTDYCKFTDCKEMSILESWNKLNEKYQFDYLYIDKDTFGKNLLTCLNMEKDPPKTLFENDGVAILQLKNHLN